MSTDKARRRLGVAGGKPVLIAALCLVFASLGLATAETPGAFDHYVLSLSWSPSYCESEAGEDDTQQCGPNRRYAFIVHGLWPQYERGWPDYCDAETRYVPEAIIDEMLDIMPSRRLIIHQWRKHGTCSGLEPDDYFALTRAAFESLRIPARYIIPTHEVVTSPEGLEHDFLSSNVWLTDDMFAVHCGNRRDTGKLREVHICFSRELDPIDCGDNEHRECRAEELVMPPIR